MRRERSSRTPRPAITGLQRTDPIASAHSGGAIAIRAPAKLNLALHVTGRRPDGYHLLESVVVFAGIEDRLTVRPADVDSFTVRGPFADGVPMDGSNLVLRARDLLRAAAHVPPLAIELQKNLPPASGIGGGSSDAAAALCAINRLAEPPLGRDALCRVGLTIGADVPMCLAGEPLVARGIGEEIAPIRRMPALALVVANPGVAVSTPAVFGALRQRNNPGLPAFDGLEENPVEWLAGCRNDLEPAASSIAREIGAVLGALQAHRPLLARMSGSGATSFAVFAAQDEAEAAAEALRARHPAWFVRATQSYASGMFDRRVLP